MYTRSLALYTTTNPAVVSGLVSSTMNSSELEMFKGWGALKAATVRTGPSVRPEPISDAPGTYGCPLNAARREGTIWESPVRWVN